MTHPGRRPLPPGPGQQQRFSSSHGMVLSATPSPGQARPGQANVTIKTLQADEKQHWAHTCMAAKMSGSLKMFPNPADPGKLKSLGSLAFSFSWAWGGINNESLCSGVVTGDGAWDHAALYKGPIKFKLTNKEAAG